METKSPSAPLNGSLEEELETLIDKHGVGHMLHVIERICSLKSDHIAENWQDNELSREWDAAATKIGLCADSLSV